MSHIEFFPYPTAPGAAVLSCSTDHSSAEIEDHRIQLQGVRDDQAVELSLTVSLDAEALEVVLPETERSDPPVALIVTVRGLQSRVRQAVRLQRSEDGDWLGRLELPKRDLYRVLDLEPVLVRTSSGTDTAYAQHVGARLAWGTPISVELDDAPIPAGGYLDVQWDDFQHSDSPRRKRNADLLYLLDTDKEPPMLWLNSGIEHLKPVMHASGPRGRNLRVRDATYDTVVSQVWTSLLSAVITKLVAELAEEEDPDAVIEAVSDWELRIIHHWAQLLFPEAADRGEAIADLLDHARMPELRATLQERVGMAVQRQARTAYAFRGLIRLRDSEGV